MPSPLYNMPAVPPGAVVLMDLDFDGDGEYLTYFREFGPGYNETFGWGNGETMGYHRPANIYEDTGNLVVKAIPEGSLYTAGMMWTRTMNWWAPLQMRMAARMKLPHAAQLWPSLWLTHRNGSSTFECDVMEYFHLQRPGSDSMAIHRLNVDNVYRSHNFFETPPSQGTNDEGTDFHTWCIDIFEDPVGHLVFLRYIDGVLAGQWVDRDHAAWVGAAPANAVWDILLDIYISGPGFITPPRTGPPWTDEQGQTQPQDGWLAADLRNVVWPSYLYMDALTVWDLTNATVTSPTMVRQNTFEAAPVGTPLNPANSGGASGDAFNAVYAGAGATVAAQLGTLSGTGTKFVRHQTGATATSATRTWSGLNYDELYDEFYFRCPGALQACPILWYDQGGSTSQCGRLYLNTDGSLAVQDSAQGDGGFRSAAGLIAPNTIYRIEVHWVFSATVGRAECRVYTATGKTPIAVIGNETANRNLRGVPTRRVPGIISNRANFTLDYDQERVGDAANGWFGGAEDPPTPPPPPPPTGYPPNILTTVYTNDTEQQDVHPAAHNNEVDALRILVSELGTDPSGTFVDVTARFDDVDVQVGDLDSRVGALEGAPPTGVAFIDAYKLAANETTITGTTLVSDAQLRFEQANATGSIVRYDLDIIIHYQADATNNGKIGLLVERPAGAGTIEGFLQVLRTPHDAADGSTFNDFEYIGVGPASVLTVKGVGDVGGAGSTGIRSLRAKGTFAVGANSTGRLTVQAAENTGPLGTGIRIKTNSRISARRLS